MTISISSAPSASAPAVSVSFAASVCVPKGKPTTLHVFTALPRSCAATNATLHGLTQTLAKPISRASAHTRARSCFVAKGFKRVWSMCEQMSITVFLSLSAGGGCGIFVLYYIRRRPA